MSDLNPIYDSFAEKLTPPFSRGEIIERQSLRAYLEDKACGAVNAIARKIYDKDVSELEYEIDGRMQSTIISIMTIKENKIRINPELFTHTGWEIIRTLRNAVGTYLESREGI